MCATRSWGSSPSLATISSNLPRCTWVLTSCVIPCWIRSRKAEALALVAFCSSLLPVGIHCACISRDLVPRAAKTYLRWSLLSGGMWLRRSQFSRGMAKYGEGMVCILGVPVIDGQAYWCCPHCQHTGNSICSGLGRLWNELLWCRCWFWGHVSGVLADNGQIEKFKERGDTKVSISLEPSVRFTSFLDTIYLRVCPTTRWHCFLWQWCHRVCMGARNAPGVVFRLRKYP